MLFDFQNFRQKLQKTLEHIRQDVATLRTGRATVQLLDPVRVEAYGSMMKINEVANVSAPEATLLVISPWDKNLLESIEKAIASSDLNLHPVVDGDLIRISIPPLTEERRREMVKILKQKIEQGRVMLRQVRNDAKKDIENLKGDSNVSEDDIEQLLTEMEDVFQEQMKILDELLQDKEKELLTV